MSTVFRKLALLALLALLGASASPVPGDTLLTAGQTGDGYTYSVNVITYSNTSADTRDIITPLTPPRLNLDASFAAADAVYRNGRNSFRNLLTGVPRVAALVIQRDYKLEPYFLSAKSYYGDGLYLDRPLGTALNGTGDYAEGGPLSCCAVRAAMASAYQRFYPALYFFHEADVGVLRLNNPDSPPTAEGVALARQELDDAVACLFAPNVKTAGGPISGRVSPGFNFYDWSTTLSREFCLYNSRARSSDVVAKLLDVFLRASELLNSETADLATVGPEYRTLREEAERYIVVSFVRGALSSAKQAPGPATAAISGKRRMLQGFARKTKKATTSAAAACSSRGCGGLAPQAAASAYWYLAENTLSTLGASGESIARVRDLLNAVAAAVQTGRKSSSSSSSSSRAYYNEVRAAIRTAVEEAGFDFKAEIAKCGA